MMGRRRVESTSRRGLLAGTGSGTAALRRPFHPVYSLLYYYAFKHRPSSRVYYSSGRASGCPIQFISGDRNTEASLYLMFWSPPIHLYSSTTIINITPELQSSGGGAPEQSCESARNLINLTLDRGWGSANTNTSPDART